MKSLRTYKLEAGMIVKGTILLIDLFFEKSDVIFDPSGEVNCNAWKTAIKTILSLKS